MKTKQFNIWKQKYEYQSKYMNDFLWTVILNTMLLLLTYSEQVVMDPLLYLLIKLQWHSLPPSNIKVLTKQSEYIVKRCYFPLSRKAWNHSKFNEWAVERQDIFTPCVKTAGFPCSNMSSNSSLVVLRPAASVISIGKKLRLQEREVYIGS